MYLVLVPASLPSIPILIKPYKKFLELKHVFLLLLFLKHFKEKMMKNKIVVETIISCPTSILGLIYS